MMERINRSQLIAGIVSLIALLVFAVAPAAMAGSLDDAKAAGQVAEGPDGYVHVLSRGAADVLAMAKDINGRRKAKYAEIAKKQGAPLEAVAARAGKKLIARTPAGQYTIDADGNPKKK